MEQIQEQAKATVVRGNVLRLRVELTLRTMQSEGETVETDKREFVPKAGSVTAKLINGARMVPMQVEMEGNYARLADYGTLELGEYSLDIRCLDEQDLPYRCKLFGAVEVVDATACAGIEPGVEFDAQVQHLEATFTQVGGGTAEQVQADWAQEDETQPDYIKNKPTIPTVPTRVSELENDAHYLTEHQDISGKVDKVPGKGLSTEDYTTEDKQKLAGLSNYDDTGIQNAINRIQNAIDALTGTGDTTAAINTMNEVTAFLAGLTNSDTLTAKLAELRTMIDQKASSAALENLATKAELASKADKSNTYTKQEVDGKMAVEIIEVTGENASATVASLLPNKFYLFTPALDALTITALGSGTGLCVYAGKFTAASASTSLNLPATVTVADSVPDIEANHVYEFNIADGVLLMVDVTAQSA